MYITFFVGSATEIVSPLVWVNRHSHVSKTRLQFVFILCGGGNRSKLELREPRLHHSAEETRLDVVAVNCLMPRLKKNTIYEKTAGRWAS